MSCLWQTKVAATTPRGHEIRCQGTGHDGDSARGHSWPRPRFEAETDPVVDYLTGLTWTRTTNATDYPLSRSEAFSFTTEINRPRAYGGAGYQLVNRGEPRGLFSHQMRRPALPDGHLFRDVFSGWY